MDYIEAQMRRDALRWAGEARRFRESRGENCSSRLDMGDHWLKEPDFARGYYGTDVKWVKNKGLGGYWKPGY